jgi:Methyltransferase domain
MSWQVRAREAGQRLGLDSRYARRLRWIHKARVLRRDQAALRHNLRYVLLDPEPDNFTYELANEHELIEWTAGVARCPRELASGYFAEPRADRELAARLRRGTAGRWLWSKLEPPYGKRLAWYALARALQPRLVIETGVHDGLGSLLLLRALERNESPGRLVSFDINPVAGWLVGAHPRWELRLEPSSGGLPTVLADGSQVGLFIHDSAHTYENERRELALAADHLAPDGVLLSDDAQVTRALAELCEQRGLAYFEVRERPLDHFYPGGSLGAGRAR